MKKDTYHSGKLPKLWDYLVTLHKETPQAFSADGAYLRAIVAQRWKELDKKAHCPNCAASMQQYDTSFDYFDAKLVEAMGAVVKAKLHKGLPFTQANMVHIQKETDADYTTKSRQTKCRTLGLVAKVIKEDGTHDQELGWVITKRGWALLRGEAIPKKIVVFRNEIIKHYPETTTMAEVMAAKQDSFTPTDWYEVAGLADGTL